MAKSSKCLLIFLATFLLAEIGRSTSSTRSSENGVKTAVFLSPKFELEPGSVINKFYYDIDFPRGHIALKSFDAEVVDEAGKSIPLYETYLHHWVVVNYYQHRGIEIPKHHSNVGFHKSDYIIAGNDGICHESGLSQIFGLGSETRKTSNHVPDPYGIEFGNPADIPSGYEEKWLLNVHAIDTRGTENRLGCTECRCDLYNVTVDEYGRNLSSDYIGGLRCCYDETRCRVKEGFQSVKRSLYLKYTIKYVDWHNSIVPVRIYIFDVTDRWKKSDGISSIHDCQIEYDVPAGANDGCIHTKSVSVILPTGGNLVYGVAHQHTGGIGSTLYGEDGRVICSSIPIYGEGKEPGNEAGYIVGMSTCYPQLGSVKISNGETLTVVSNYSSGQGHTGVMGLFYILVAHSDSSAKLNSSQHAPLGIHRKMLTSDFIGGMALLGVAILAAVIVAYQKRNQRRDNYEPIMM